MEPKANTGVSVQIPEGLLIVTDRRKTEPFLKYFLSIAAAFLGTRFDVAEVDARRQPNNTLYYTNRPPRKEDLHIPQCKGYSSETIPLVSLVLNTLPIQGCTFPFDIVRATEFWLIDQPHHSFPLEELDRHNRVPASRTFTAQCGIADQPAVNAYLLLFGKWIQEKLGIDLPGYLPPGKKCIVSLSHDVDTPVDPVDISHDLWKIAWRVYHLKWKGIVNEFSRLSRKLKHYNNLKNEKYWLFNEVVAAEAAHGFTSSFFFSALFDPSSRHGYDVTYDIRAPRFRNVFRMLRERGFEVGLHGSYRSSKDVHLFTIERQLLQRCSATRVLGNRQHCWRLSRDFRQTLGSMAQSGLAYDTSIALNDIPGFRLGIAFPFFPFCPRSLTAIPIMELPVMLMDGAYCYEKEPAVDEVVVNFRNLLANLKSHRGVGCIDWHVTTAFPGSRRFRQWGNAYLAILDVLASDREVAVIDCAGVYDYCSKIYSRTSATMAAG